MTNQNTTPDTNIDYLSPEGLAILAKLYPDHNAVDRELFARQCNRTQLDPLGRQIYSVLRQGKWVTQTSIDGFRVIAQRTGEYEGQSGPQWCGPDGKWLDVWLDDKPPAAARVGVHRRGFREPLWSIARYDGYVTTTRDNRVTSVWAKMPELMIAKCAEALGLRRAFPQELSGLYTTEEMLQADKAPEDAPAAPAIRTPPKNDPDLEAALKRSVAQIAEAREKVAKLAPEPDEPVKGGEVVAVPVENELPTVNQDFDIVAMRQQIEACDTPEAMTALLPKVLAIRDEVVRVAVNAIFKKHREAKGWLTARNSKGEPGVVAK